MKLHQTVSVVFFVVSLCSLTSSEESTESNESLQTESSTVIDKRSSEYSKEQEFAGRKDMLHRRVQRDKEAEYDRKLVTIDLSALRPSLPGLVLFKYGDQAPKLVQVDIATLNPLIQPHVIWPQFHQEIDSLETLPYDALEEEEIDNIPYLGEGNYLVPKQQQRMAKITSDDQSSDWPDLDDLAGGDIYDFIPNSFRNEELMALHDSLPLAEEVIVPLDWEESEHHQHQGKRNLFLTHGWKPSGIQSRDKSPVLRASSRNHDSVHQDIHYTSLFGSSGWRPARKKNSTPKAFHPHRRHPGVESEAIEHPRKSGYGKNNLFLTKGWGLGGRSLKEMKSRRPGNAKKQSSRDSKQKNDDNNFERISGQDIWSVPRQHWNVPQNFGMHW